MREIDDVYIRLGKQASVFHFLSLRFFFFFLLTNYCMYFIYACAKQLKKQAVQKEMIILK